MRGTWRIAKIFGIDINIDSSWLIVFVLITWTLAGLVIAWRVRPVADKTVYRE